MSYDHKKSLREVTDVQMSDGTSVDGSRIDRALDEASERFNNLEGGDFSEMFTKTQFVFGMQPSPVVPVPQSDPSSGSGNPKYGTIKSILTQTDRFPICGQWLPWLPIINNSFSSHSTTPSGGTYAAKFDVDGYEPSAGFQNKWRLKGTNVINRPDASISNPPPVLSKSMDVPIPWSTTGWGDAWSGLKRWDGTGAGSDYNEANDEPAPQTTWQFAWSHSWEFVDPVILDDIMLFVRTDRAWDNSADKYAAGGTVGWYDAPYEYTGASRMGGVFYRFSCRDIMFQISVDNPFSTEERNYNDIEATFNSRPADGWSVSQTSMNGMQYTDMLPNSPEYGVHSAGQGDALSGKMFRFSGLNIPIRKMARVRLSVVLPWYKPMTASAFANSQVSMTRGMAPSRWNANVDSIAITSKTAAPDPYIGTSLLGAPWDNCSINGTMTVLEDVE